MTPGEELSFDKERVFIARITIPRVTTMNLCNPRQEQAVYLAYPIAGNTLKINAGSRGAASIVRPEA
jgi:hypothetical protein